MKVGFTGTRRGMSRAQVRQLQLVFEHLFPFNVGTVPAWEFHHGDEPHADQEAAAEAYLRGLTIIPHPPKSRTAKHLLARDKDIANICDVLIAAPRTDKEELRSGTWATVRYARAAGKPIIMLSRCEGRLIV